MIWKKAVIMIKDKPRCMRNFTTLLFAMDVYQIYIVFVFTKEYFIAKTIIFFVIKEKLLFFYLRKNILYPLFLK